MKLIEQIETGATIVFANVFIWYLKLKLRGNKMAIDKQVGPEAELKIDGADGKLRISLDYAGADMSAGLFVATTPDQLCNALAKLIPGDSSAEAIALGVVKGALELSLKGI